MTPSVRKLPALVNHENCRSAGEREQPTENDDRRISRDARITKSHRWIGRSAACPPWRGRCYSMRLRRHNLASSLPRGESVRRRTRGLLDPPSRGLDGMVVSLPRYRERRQATIPARMLPPALRRLSHRNPARSQCSYPAATSTGWRRRDHRPAATGLPQFALVGYSSNYR